MTTPAGRPLPLLVSSTLTAPLLTTCSIQVRCFAGVQGTMGSYAKAFRWGSQRKKGRWYYRYHKPLGHGNWQKYIERYETPRELESRQRLVFSTRADYRTYKQAISWQWKLPKAIAEATTVDEVLDAWMLYRHRRFKQHHHFFKVLQRLVEVQGANGHVNTSDWRLAFITKKLRGRTKQIVNTPRLARLYSRLGSGDHMWFMVEKCTRYLAREDMLRRYKPYQLVWIADAWGSCRLRDTYLFNRLARYLSRVVPQLSSDQLITVLVAYGRCEVTHTVLVGKILSQLLTRKLSVQQHADIVSALALLRVQDYTALEMASHAAVNAINTGVGYSTEDLCRIADAHSTLKVNDIKLMQNLLAHARDHGYDWSPLNLAKLGQCAAPVVASDKKAFAVMLDELNMYVPIMESLEEITAAANFAYLHQRYHPQALDGNKLCTSLVEKLALRVPELTNQSPMFNIAQLARSLTYFKEFDQKVWFTILKHSSKSAEWCEAKELLSLSYCLHRLKPSLAKELPMRTVAMAQAQWALKRKEEFAPYDWDRIRSWLRSRNGYHCGKRYVTEMAEYRKLTKGPSLRLSARA
ncbi:hypothetical protein FOL47_010896 [Perkinsus chesapeaki]|uniref:Uncharacterized protein n=1 Tax=Perkinsus chesapeaki TaxID=330153 RepID=A0A7J6KZW8_PERCH|nr:hypothetical protein FOL47_010896 [Perkinsus chesapeaki]